MPAEATLTQASNPFSEVEAARLLENGWGIRGRITRLAGERDDNFHVKTDCGDYFLKVAHAFEAPAVTNLTTAALLHLERVAPSLPVQRVVSTASGEPELRFAAASGEGSRTARLTTFVAGPLLKSTPTSRRLRAEIGRTLGQLNVAFRSFDHPAANRELLWDLQHVDRLTPLLADLDHPERALLEAGVERWRERVAPRQLVLRRQIVHNDLSGDNVVLDQRCGSIKAVVDFGDIVRTQLVNDVAIAVSYQLSENDIPFVTAAEVAVAYHLVDPLEPEELALVHDLVNTRMLMRVIISEWRGARFPEKRAYVLRYTPHSWRQLKRLSSEDPDDATERLLRLVAAS